MVSTAPAAATRQTQGIILMVLAMLSIPLVDGLAKFLSVTHSPLFISWARYAVASMIVLPFAIVVHGRHVFPTERRLPHTLRTIFLVSAMTLYFLAIARVPLATATSVFFIGPIAAVVLSVVLLKERMTVRKSASLVLGFAGSLVILRPGSSTDPGLLLALGSGILFAFYLITTRQASQSSDPVKTLAFQCIVGMLLLTPQAIVSWSVPAAADLKFFVALGLLSAVSHILSISAFRFAEASILAPLVYLELIGAAVIGLVVFDEIPGRSTLAGAGLIAVGGLLLVERTRKPT